MAASAKKKSVAVVMMAAGAVFARSASSKTEVVVDDPRVKGIARILSLAISPDNECLRSMISPVFQSYPPQNERGSLLTKAIPDAEPGENDLPLIIILPKGIRPV